MSFPRITLLTAASAEYWPLMEMAGPNKMEYCLRHKIQLAMNVHGRIGADGNWGERETFMLDALDAYDADWLWFMGADSLITNMTIDIRTMCYIAYDFIIGVDVHGINNDVFLLKNSKASKDFLKRVLTRRDLPHDQLAMHHEMDKCGMKSAVVPQKLFNSYKYDEYDHAKLQEGDWTPGDFVIQFPGLRLERRVELMKEFLNKIKRD
jgi:hypothetical protein